MAQITNSQLPENGNEESSKRARLITAAYNIIGIAVGIAGLFSATTNYALMALIFYPLSGIVIVLFGKGEIKFISDDKSRIYGSINLGFLITSLFVLFKSVDDYTLYQTDKLWLPFIIVGAIILAALYQAGINPFEAKKRAGAIFTLIIGLIYAYGSTKEINCAFDNSNSQIYNATILAHREHRARRSSSWYLTLSPWGPMQEVNEEEIDGWLYDHTAIGDTVKVSFKQGLLHIPWFVVTKN